MTLRSNPRRNRSSLWARPLWSNHRHHHRCRRGKQHGRGHSDRIIAIIIVVRGASGMSEAIPINAIVITTPISPISLSLVFGGWLFWLLVVGWFWLMVVGWSGCGCEIWVDIGVWVWVDRVLIVVFVWVFFFFFGSSGWYWWSVVDLWGWPVVVGCGGWSAVWVVVAVAVVNDNGEEIIYYFNV